MVLDFREEFISLRGEKEPGGELPAGAGTGVKRKVDFLEGNVLQIYKSCCYHSDFSKVGRSP